jgi:hypothetical protein
VGLDPVVATPVATGAVWQLRGALRAGVGRLVAATNASVAADRAVAHRTWLCDPDFAAAPRRRRASGTLTVRHRYGPLQLFSVGLFCTFTRKRSAATRRIGDGLGARDDRCALLVEVPTVVPPDRPRAGPLRSPCPGCGAAGDHRGRQKRSGAGDRFELDRECAWHVRVADTRSPAFPHCDRTNRNLAAAGPTHHCIADASSARFLHRSAPADQDQLS